MENINNKEAVNKEEVKDLRKEDVIALQKRTNELFEIMAMCDGNEEQIQLCRNEVIETNIRLVPHVLKKYRPYGDDEFQLGCLGLIMATHKFDVSRGIPFVNFACFCIERELHKAHRKFKGTFEGQVEGGVQSLDDTFQLENGDETSKYEKVADEMSEEAFNKILEDFNLDDLFERVIMPAITDIASTNKGVKKSDYDEWQRLELRYILEMAEVDSQKARLSLSAIAKELGLSVQNVRVKHQRVLESIRQKCSEVGIHIN